MKKRVIGVLGFYAFLIVFASLLFYVQISHFGGLAGMIVLDDSLGNEALGLGSVGIIVVLALVFEVLLVIIFRIKGKRIVYGLTHELR